MPPDNQNTQGLEAAVLAIAAAVQNNKGASITVPYSALGSVSIKDLKVEVGWTRVNPTASTAALSTVAFNTKFAAPPLVLLSHAGYSPTNNAPFPGSSIGGYIDNLMLHPTEITTAQFVANWTRAGGATFNPAHTLFASYMAIGI